MKSRTIILFVLLLAFFSCQDEKVHVPKPRMFPKVNYPQKSFHQLDIIGCPFKMEIPKYFQYLKDTTSLQKLKVDASTVACWFDLYSEELNSHIHLSYYDINKSEGFDKLVADAFEMADKHNVKANYRDEIKVNDPERNLHGIVFVL